MLVQKLYFIVVFSAMFISAPSSAQESSAAPEIAVIPTENHIPVLDQKSADVEVRGAGSVDELGSPATRVGPLGQKEEITGINAVADKIAPVLVSRNSIVLMEYSFGPLTIQTEGRALSQGRGGELVRIMNLSSKSIVAATVAGPSKVIVK